MTENKKKFVDNLRRLSDDGDESARASLALLSSGETRLVEDRATGAISVVAGGEARLRQPSLVRLTSRPQHHFSFPHDQSVVDAVRQKMEEGHDNQEAAAAAIGIGRKHYALIAKLLILKTRNIPNWAKEKIDAALATIEQRRQTKEALEMTTDILDRYWEKKKEPTYKTKKRRIRLEQAVIRVTSTCQAMDDVEIPRDLSAEEAKDALSEIALSIEALSRLMRRMIGEES